MALYNPFNPMDAEFALGSPAPGSMSTTPTLLESYEAYYAQGAIGASQSSATTQSSLNAQQNISDARQLSQQGSLGLAFPEGVGQNATAQQSENYQPWASWQQMDDLRTMMEREYIRLMASYARKRVVPEPAERLPFTQKPEVPF